MERMDRRWEFIPKEEIAKLAENNKPELYSDDWMVDKSKFVYADWILGKTFDFVFDDGLKMHYEFVEQKKCIYQIGNEPVRESFYRAIPEEGCEDVIFIHQYMDGVIPARCNSIILDTISGYVTAVTAEIGTLEANPREVQRTFHFGEVKGFKHPAGSEKHHFDEGMVGKAIEWTMMGFTGREPMKHIYIAPKYYLIHMTRGETCFMAADIADYVKIRDDIFLVSIMEQRRSGIQLNFLINTTAVRDVTGRFGISYGNEASQGGPKIMCNMLLGRIGKFVPIETHYNK